MLLSFGGLSLQGAAGSVEVCGRVFDVRVVAAPVMETAFALGTLVFPLLGLAYDAGQQKRAKFPTSKAPISAVFHSFRLIFGRAIISRNGLEAWMLLLGTRARGTLTLKRT